MKAGKAFSALLGIGLAAIVLLAGCRNRQGEGYIDQLVQLEQSGFRGQPPKLSTVEDLKKAIEEKRAEVEKKVTAAKDLGVYYKMLAIKYLDADMYGLALDSLSKAIEIFPENSQLFYYSAVSSARMAKAQTADPQKTETLFQQAEAFYKRAIFLDPTYTEAEYGLAVLYAFERGAPEKAEPLLKSILEKNKSDMDALFLLARVYYQTGRSMEAIEVYDKILGMKQPEKIQKQAEDNKKQIEEELYAGSR
jgi:cytochrome c-type biogenesis protein CcmH/NrfG